jgi:hypothetical protein
MSKKVNVTDGLRLLPTVILLTFDSLRFFVTFAFDFFCLLKSPSAHGRILLHVPVRNGRFSRINSISVPFFFNDIITYNL